MSVYFCVFYFVLRHKQWLHSTKHLPVLHNADFLSGKHLRGDLYKTNIASSGLVEGDLQVFMNNAEYFNKNQYP